MIVKCSEGFGSGSCGITWFAPAEMTAQEYATERARIKSLPTRITIDTDFVTVWEADVPDSPLVSALWSDPGPDIPAVPAGMVKANLVRATLAVKLGLGDRRLDDLDDIEETIVAMARAAGLPTDNDSVSTYSWQLCRGDTSPEEYFQAKASRWAVLVGLVQQGHRPDYRTGYGWCLGAEQLSSLDDELNRIEAFMEARYVTQALSQAADEAAEVEAI